jgi:hypothetical protein
VLKGGKGQSGALLEKPAFIEHFRALAGDPLWVTISAAFLVVAQSGQPSYDPPNLVNAGAGLLTGERVVWRLAAILAADVVGYSRLMGRDDVIEQRSVKRASRCRLGSSAAAS